MSMPDDHVYLFLHIPRTAGTTLITNLRYGLRRAETLHLAPLPGRRLLTRPEVDEQVDSLGAGARNRLRLVHGHSVYYGLHEKFERPARYVAFLRDPVTRAISNYQYMLSNYDVFLADNDDGTLPRRREDLSFERWWRLFQHDLQLAVVLNYLIDGGPGWECKQPLTPEHLARGKRVLDEFWFVGLTESFEEDSLFLYSRLGLDRRLGEALNVHSGPLPDLGGEARDGLARDTRLDADLYAHGVALNRAFKEQHPTFREEGQAFAARARIVVPVRRRAFELLSRWLGLRRAAALRTALRRVLRR